MTTSARVRGRWCVRRRAAFCLPLMRRRSSSGAPGIPSAAHGRHPHEIERKRARRSDVPGLQVCAGSAPLRPCLHPHAIISFFLAARSAATQPSKVQKAPATLPGRYAGSEHLRPTLTPPAVHLKRCVLGNRRAIWISHLQMDGDISELAPPFPPHPAAPSRARAGASGALEGDSLLTSSEAQNARLRRHSCFRLVGDGGSGTLAGPQLVELKICLAICSDSKEFSPSGARRSRQGGSHRPRRARARRAGRGARVRRRERSVRPMRGDPWNAHARTPPPALGHAGSVDSVDEESNGRRVLALQTGGTTSCICKQCVHRVR
jgi:hypothetical protein